MNLSLAAGDIPELMPGIPLSMFQNMAAGDLAADITDVYESTAQSKAGKWGVRRYLAVRQGPSPAFPAVTLKQCLFSPF